MKYYEDTIKSIRALSKQETLVTNISQLLYEQRCFYLLSKVGKDDIYYKRQQVERRMNRIHLSQRYQELRSILVYFEEQGIVYVVIKGAVLAKCVYGDESFRTSADVDLLIHRKDIDKVKAILLQNGFIQGKILDNHLVPFNRRELIFCAGCSHQVAEFIKKVDNSYSQNIVIDVNLDVLWGEAKQRSDMEYILAMREKINICGVEVYKLNKEIEFAVLCLHHYKHMNSIYLLANGDLKLGLFCDIYEYLQHLKPSIIKLNEICSYLNVKDYVYYCIYYTNIIFESKCLNEYMSALKTDHSEELLPNFGLIESEYKNWTITFEERLLGTNFTIQFLEQLDQKSLDKIRMNKKVFEE